MALPSSGTLSISDIASEFGDTAPNSMSEFYRGGGLVPDSATNSSVPTSGAIAIGNFYGAANRVAVPLTISANTQNYDVYTQASASPLYVAGTSDVTLTINPGILVGSSSTGTYALSIPGSFNPGDTVTVVNDGVVLGRGGNGGNGGSAPSGGGGAGATGGNAVYVNFPTVITNNGTLAGGGGGGGGGGRGRVYTPAPPKGTASVTWYGGGGGGGGAGYPGGSGGSGGSSPSGYPGVPGSSGSTTGGGAGGNGPGPAGSGGSGGGRGANGNAGGAGTSPTVPGGAGGTRGYYLVGNSLVTFPATGTLQGRVS